MVFNRISDSGRGTPVVQRRTNGFRLRRGRRRAVASMFVAATLALTAGAVQARTVSARGHAVAHIERLDVLRFRNHRPRDAKRVFGPAVTLVDGQGECRLRWPALHMTLDYWSFGIVNGDACSDTFLQEGFLGPGWQTAAGLTVGETLGRLRRIYRRATRQRSRWALLPYVSNIGAPGAVGSPLWAIVHHGRVTQLQAFVGDAGE